MIFGCEQEWFIITNVTRNTLFNCKTQQQLHLAAGTLNVAACEFLLRSS